VGIDNPLPTGFFDKREHKQRSLPAVRLAAGMMAMADVGLGNHVPAGEEDRWGSYIGAGLGAVQTIDFGG
jgi:hypothetical protein